ncbi:MAG: cysteine desulfurase [Lachnospiraceae bacterium]|nr:cysteine desulfurase [Lachnospiraceae bacterium]
MEAYLDNSATTFVTESVRSEVIQAMETDFGNPSSQHMKGVEAEQIVRRARETIASTLKCSEKEIFFTSGGTEANNWALIGGAMANRRRGTHLITTAVEHASVLMPMQYLEKQGFRVTYLPVDRMGHADPEDLRKALCDETILVSMMHVNNEVGAIEPVEKAAAIVKEFSPDILFHVDAVQSYGKYAIRPGRMKIDLLSVSGHKLHGPKGSGFLYIREKTKINPLILGGGQQKGMRSGTDNVPGIAGMARAAADCYEHLEENTQHLKMLRDRLREGLMKMDGVVLHSGCGDESAVHIVNASFVGVRSEVMLHALEEKGIYVSAGSACSSNKKLPVSNVLVQLGIPVGEQESALRFSFSRFNTAEEVDYALEEIGRLLPVLRRFTRH